MDGPGFVYVAESQLHRPPLLDCGRVGVQLVKSMGQRLE